MSNDIIEFLDLKDEELIFTDLTVTDTTKYIWLEKSLSPMFCPNCNHRMHSKGCTLRTIRHPILQNGYQLILKVKQRRWLCQNEQCKFIYTDDFSFVAKHKQTTNFVPYLLIEVLKDLSVSVRSAAKRYNLSDTTVRNYVLQHLDIPRLPLPKYLSVDEVYLHLDDQHKYALVLMDFKTQEIVDIVQSRREKDTRHYFYSIPLEERKKVEFLICDMYNPYVNFTKSYFRNASVIIDSFHVVSWLITKLNQYIHQVRKKLQKRDDNRREETNYFNNTKFQTIKESNELYILNKYQWVLLKNNSHITYSTTSYYDKTLCRYLNTYDIIQLFLSIDSHFDELRSLKELYVEFNDRNLGNPEAAKFELDELIELYSKSDEKIFREFSFLLKKFYNEIFLSFEVIHQETDPGIDKIRRLSNGPIESFNRKPKDYKRNSRGVDDFNFTRLRLLLATRSNIHILGTPKRLKDVLNKTGKTRGSYKK